jgi:hypothetical protein
MSIDEIIRVEGRSDIIEIGGKKREASAEIAMHKSTGIVFIKRTFKDNSLYCFVVGKLDENGEVQEKKEYFEKTEKDFFDAVRYFEELIKKMQPEDDSSSTPPSIGKLYYFKKKAATVKSYSTYVEMPGLPIVEIDQHDLDIVFTPPKSRPYGRLDMTAVDQKPKYDTIQSKFALKYDKEASEQISKAEGIDLSDLAVYDMTPYSNDTNPQEDGTPEEVNDETLSPDQIEGEDLNDDKNKREEKEKRDQNKKDQKDKADKGDKSDEKDKGDGEKGDGDGDQEETDENQGDESQSDQSDGDAKDPGKKSARQDIIQAITDLYAGADLKDQFRRQKNLIASLDGFTETELKQSIYKKLGVSENLTKSDFLALVETKTKNLFQ